jgi:hypothetical protein
MHAYACSSQAWRGGNRPNAEVCSSLECAARAAIALIALLREHHVHKSNQKLPVAAPNREQKDSTAYQAPFPSTLFPATGIAWGKMRPPKSQQGLWQFLLAAAAAFLLAYSVSHWSWPPVGFEWAMYVAWLCLILGSLFTLGAGVVLLRLLLRQSSDASKALLSQRSEDEG